MSAVDIIQGDALHALQSFSDGAAQTCVTSPPYYGLRDYGVDGQIGLEETPDEYVNRLVRVFREVRRVLRDDGTLWLNIGDSYANDSKWGGSSSGKHARALHGETGIGRQKRFTGLPSKNLIGIPWMLAFALRADGWILRQEIIWAKPAPMPEPVKDRCTKAHESVFLLSKSPRYYFDADAIAEPAIGQERPQRRRAIQLAEEAGLTEEHFAAIRAVGLSMEGKTQFTQEGAGRNSARFQALADEAKAVLGDYYREFTCKGASMSGKRNRRDVWTVASTPFKEAHFATMPVELASLCIQAGSKPGDVVLDPFMGAYTTALAALRNGRDAIGAELNSDYIAIGEKRIQPTLKRLAAEKAQQPLFGRTA